MTRRVRIRPLAEAPPERVYDLRLLAKLAPFARGQLALFAVATVFVPVLAYLAIQQPILRLRAIDAAVRSQSVAALTHVAAVYGAVIAIEFVARFIQTMALQVAGQRTVAALRSAVFARVQRLPQSTLDRTPLGRLVTRVTNDTDAVGELFASGAILAFADVVLLIAIVVAMFALDARLTLTSLIAVPPLVACVQWIRRRAREAFRTIRSAIAQLNAYMAEQVQGLAIVKAFGRERECAAEYADINAVHRDANYASIRYDALLFSVVESIEAITVAIVLWVGARAVGVGGESLAYVGVIVAFHDYVQRFFAPIRDLSTKYTILQSSLAAAERIFETLGGDEVDAPRSNTVAAPVDGPASRLQFDRVTFGYRKDLPVLRGLDLSIQAGERLAIVGATGSGKSTLVSLVLRLHDPNEGSIRWDGVDVRSLPADELRGRIAFVPQDVFLFGGTIAENISGFSSNPDRDRVHGALVRAQAWDCVAQRGGVDAEVTERGGNFSAGERQLLALARALYLERPLIILDEATANVDSETEARLDKAISEALDGRTAIVIAHRLSTIRKATRIVVLQQGVVVEEGTHDSLLARGGTYARLHALHFASDDASVRPTLLPV